MEESTIDGVNKESSNQVTLLRIALRVYLQQISSAVTLEKFTELFGSVVGRSSKMKRLLEVYHRLMFEEMMKEMEEFIKDEDLDGKFSLLTKLKKECVINEDSVQVWRPETANIDQQMRSHDMEEKLKRKKELEELCIESDSKVEYLRMQVTAGRSKALQIGAKVSQIKKKLKDESTQDQNTEYMGHDAIVQN